MNGLIGQIEAVPRKRDELVAILAGMGDMPGCRSYIVAKDPTDRDAIAKGRPLIASFTARIETDPVGGIGLG